jgi:hypothetical protein
VFVRLFFLAALLFIDLYGCKACYPACKAKIKDSHTLQSKAVALPVAGGLKLCTSLQRPDEKIIKYDPFLSLYLVKSSHLFAYPFSILETKASDLALITNNGVYKGDYTTHQIGLNQFGVFFKKTKEPGVVMSSCCLVSGVTSSRGIIEAPYLKHFLKSKKSSYGDIGIRITQGAVVGLCDPFFKNNPFKNGDKILSFDGKRVNSSSQLMQEILFGELGSIHRVVLLRSGKKKYFKVTSQKRYGGGYLSDTFLERKGFYFNQQLQLAQESKAVKSYGLKLGDKLIMVDGVKVSSQEELRELIARKKSYKRLLFRRDGFDFFVNIK